MDELCDMLLDEFTESGLKDDDEPNERGLAIEELVDLFNSFRDD